MHSFLHNGFAAVVKQLNEFGNPEYGEWVLFRAIKTSMYSSGEHKTAWVFCR